MKSFIICTTQRSGSTLLCEIIKKQNQLGSPGENLSSYGTVDWELDKFEKELRNLPLSSGLQKLLPYTSSDNNIASMKVMMSTLEAILKNHDKNILNSKELYSVFNKNYNNPSFIFLKRRDKIKQAISHAYLHKTKIAHIETEEESLKLKEIKKNIKLTVSEAIEMFNYTLKAELKWRLFFITNNINPHIIYFEDFLKDRKRTLNNLAEFIGIDFNYIPVEKELFIKTSDDTQQQLENDIYTYILKNYSETTLLEYGINLNDLKKI